MVNNETFERYDVIERNGFYDMRPSQGDSNPSGGLEEELGPRVIKPEIPFDSAKDMCRRYNSC